MPPALSTARERLREEEELPEATESEGDCGTESDSTSATSRAEAGEHVVAVARPPGGSSPSSREESGEIEGSSSPRNVPPLVAASPRNVPPLVVAADADAVKAAVPVRVSLAFDSR